MINPLGIFDSKYRRYMGEYLITMGLMVIPIYIAFIFMIIPGIVLSLAWSLAYYFLIEKGKNPIEALKASNDATYGSKWTMFAVALVFGIMVPHRVRHLVQRDLRHDQRRLHHLPRDVCPDRARAVDRHGDRCFVLEAAEDNVE